MCGSNIHAPLRKRKDDSKIFEDPLVPFCRTHIHFQYHWSYIPGQDQVRDLHVLELRDFSYIVIRAKDLLFFPPQLIQFIEKIPVRRLFTLGFTLIIKQIMVLKGVRIVVLVVGRPVYVLNFLRGAGSGWGHP